MGYHEHMICDGCGAEEAPRPLDDRFSGPISHMGIAEHYLDRLPTGWGRLYMGDAAVAIRKDYCPNCLAGMTGRDDSAPLREAARKLLGLYDDHQPGLITWSQFWAHAHEDFAGCASSDSLQVAPAALGPRVGVSRRPRFHPGAVVMGGLRLARPHVPAAKDARDPPIAIFEQRARAVGAAERHSRPTEWTMSQAVTAVAETQSEP